MTKLLTWINDRLEIVVIRDRIVILEAENARLKETLRTVDIGTEREVNRIMGENADLQRENARLRARLCEMCE